MLCIGLDLSQDNCEIQCYRDFLTVSINIVKSVEDFFGIYASATGEQNRSVLCCVCAEIRSW